MSGSRAAALGLLCVLCASPQKRNASILFEDAAERAGVLFTADNCATPRKHQVETMLAGVALLDYNNDGLLDIYFTNGASLPGMDKSDPKYWNRLYRNDGNGRFTDVTEAAGVRGAGYGMGIAAADFDNDGNVDLFVAGVNRNQLFHNNGDGTFSDLTTKAGLAGMHPKLGKTFSISAGWFDYDNDGWLDLFVVNYVRWDIANEPVCQTERIRAYCSPDSYDGEPNMLFHNNRDGTFTNVSDASGIGKLTGKGMGVAFADYDGDGFTDVFVSNDTFRNFLFHNNGNGTFSEVGIVSGIAYNETGKSIAGMGTDFRDIDNDGRPDIFVAAMINDTFPLFHNTGRGFIDVTSASGLARATAGVTGWGSAVADFDNDGLKDIFVACASILDNSELVDNLPSKLPNLVLRNAGGNRFEDASKDAGASFRISRSHRGVAVGDLDNDGRIDVVVTALNSRAEVFFNRSPEAGHWLSLRLIGTRSNRDGLGAKVRLTGAGGAVQYNHATTSTGFSASSDRRVHFGLGSAATVKEVEILWPSGARQQLKDVQADRVLTVREP